MQTPTAIDSLILKPTRESIDLVTLIGSMKLTNFANELNSVTGLMKRSAEPIRSVIASHLKTD